jgi:hypothetical protein
MRLKERKKRKEQKQQDNETRKERKTEHRKEQKERLDDIHKCGGIVYICTEVDKKATLIEWSKMKF